jgi:threonine aldolase
VIDLRSDTVTTPTPEMRRAMAAAEVGDDVYGEDPTVRRLEEMAADLLGFEAALFVPSGTMGNQLAVLTHTRPGDEVLVEAEAHIYYYEQGGIARLAGAQPRPVATPDGHLTPSLLDAALRGPDLHFPRPSLLCVENTHNRAGGEVLGVDECQGLAAWAHAHGLRCHLDGARIFNAAIALAVPARALAQPFDSVMFCLSKGLGAPVGSLLVGARDFIAEARRGRKVLGGGMRQAGVLAAAGIVALSTMVNRLEEDHRNAALLADRLAEVPGLVVEPMRLRTNMVMVQTDRPAAEVVLRLREAGVLVNAVGPRRIRLVTHKDVSRDDCLAAVRRFAEALAA